MVQLAALAVQPSPFDPVRSALAGASLFGNSIQQFAGLQQGQLAALQLRDAQQRQSALEAFQSHGGFGNPQALQHLVGEPQLFGSALQGYSAYNTWQNTENARGAQRVLLAGDEGSQDRLRAWNEELARALAERRIDQSTHAQLMARGPSDEVLNRIIDMSRPPGSPPSIGTVLSTPMPLDGTGGPPQTPPVGGPRPPPRIDPQALTDAYNLRDRLGLHITPQDYGAPSSVVMDMLRAQQQPPPSGGPQVRGWLSTAEAQTPPTGSTRGTQENPLSEQEMQALPQEQRYGQYFTSGGRVLFYSRSGLVPVDDQPPGAPPAPGVTPPSVTAPSGMGLSLGGLTPQSLTPQGLTPQGGMQTVSTPGLTDQAFSGGPSPQAPPQTPPRRETIGQAIQRIIMSPTISQADRVHFFTLYRDPAKFGDAMKFLSDIAGTQHARTAELTAEGTARGQAVAGLPGAMQAGQSMIENIDQVMRDPNLSWVTGRQADWSTGSPWNPLTHIENIPTYLANIPNIGSSPSLHTTRERIAQIQGQAFLEAYQALRGGGQISDAEGAAARQAIARLGNLAQDDEGYMQALNDARRQIWDLMNLARVKAGQQPMPYQAAPVNHRPVIGAVEDGYRFIGGDPSQRSSWEAVR